MIKINLLPERMLRRRRVLPFITFVIILSLLGILICVFLFSPITKEVKLVTTQLASVQKEVQQNQLALSKLRMWEKEKINLQSHLEAIESLTINQPQWPELLYTISKSLPKTVWLSMIRKDVQGGEDAIVIEGNGLNQAVDIAIFMKNLSNSPIFESVRFSDISRKRINGKEVTEFKINCKLRKNTMSLQGTQN